MKGQDYMVIGALEDVQKKWQLQKKDHEFVLIIRLVGIYYYMWTVNRGVYAGTAGSNMTEDKSSRGGPNALKSVNQVVRLRGHQVSTGPE